MTRRKSRPLPKWIEDTISVIGAAVAVGSMLVIAIGFSG